jgi:PEP-CTERM motif
MKSLFRALAGAVIAVSATWASAQQTLTFEEPPVGQGQTLNTYQGFSFLDSSAGGWALFGSGSPYSIPGGGNYNISGMGSSGPDMLDAWVFKPTNSAPFTLQGLSGCCGPIFLELVPKAGGLSTFLGWDGVDPGTSGGIFTNGLGQPNAGTFSLSGPNAALQLEEVVVWSYGEQFAIDDIRVTVVPEPSSYAMMIAGLGAMVFVARRRKSQQPKA